MNTLEYRTVDKSTWGAGPWQSEPDKKQWQDMATGLPCLIVRAPSGALCGYAGVDQQHLFHGKSYMDIDHLECHGGLTFSESCHPNETPETGICHITGPDEPDHVWWLGFDCAHCNDLTPGSDALMRSVLGNAAFLSHGVYRDFSYVTQQVTQLAQQLHHASIQDKKFTT